MTTNYTPGPWKIAHQASDYDIKVVVDYDLPDDYERTVARVNGLDNAFLIAQAPAMYVALKSLAWLQPGDQVGASDVEVIKAILNRIPGG